MSPAGPRKAGARSRAASIGTWLVRIFLLAIAGVLCWSGWISWQIITQARRDEARKADVLVVFGAAEYAGRPSPVLKARLDHTLELYERGIAPLIITTGGPGGDANHTEGEVGRDYLRSRGVAESNLIAESHSSDTAESAERVAAIMRTNQLHSCVAVSDAYHLFRAKQMLAAQGVEVYGSPRPQSKPRGQFARLMAVEREMLSYALWQLHLT